MSEKPAANTLPFRQHIAAQIECMDANPADSKLGILRRRDEAALAEAEAWDTLGGRADLYGLSVAVKALFDVQGWPTGAGSQFLDKSEPASSDAAMVAQLRRQGAVITSQTNMTEFAFGALGLNPHFGSPRTPLDPDRQRVAGGSTSGGAVAVACGFADLALGSDTSGSIRIPAAFCGGVGFKPSQGRYDSRGMLNLSPTFDVPGFIARDVETCARADRALARSEPVLKVPDGLRGHRFLVPPKFALDYADNDVVRTFEEAMKALKAAGARIVERDMPELDRYGEVAIEGGMIISEAFSLHSHMLEEFADEYDPRVGPRIALGENVKAHAYFKARHELEQLSESYRSQLAGFDALLTPTVPMLPPKVADLETDENYYSPNRLSFRLTEVANRIDAPSVTLPFDPKLPVGVLLTGANNDDQSLLALSQAVETVFRSSSR